MTEERIGKIKSISFGLGGYQDACIGLHVTLGGDGWGVSDTKSAWDKNLIKNSDHCKWTEKDRDKQYSEIMRDISDLLADAKVSTVEQLNNIPVMVTFEGNMLKSWRILKEAL